MKKRYIILGAVLAVLLLAVPAGAAVTDSSGNSYSTYDQIYASSLSSQEKLALVQEMAGMTEELEEYLAWKAAGGDSTTTSSTNLTSGTGSTKVPAATLTGGSKVTTGTTATSTYTEEEQAAYEEQLAAYQTTFAANYRATAAYSGSGSGTESDPYIITTPAELQAMADDLTAYYQLANDIDMSGFSFSPISSFSGTLNGNGHIIYNLVLTSPTSSDYGMFINADGLTLLNIGFHDIIITGTSSTYRIGLISHSSFNTPCTIENCFITGNYNTGSFIGGFFGADAYADINNCWIDINININGGDNSIGSFTGGSTKLHISNCYSLSSITGANNRPAGGFIGTAYPYEGGTASPESSLINSVYLGDISGSNIRGAFVGHLYQSDVISFSNNYAKSGSYTLDNGATIYDENIFYTISIYEDTLGWDFADTWYWDETANLPKLQVFRPSVPPTISAISATPATGGQTTEYTLSVTATTEASGGIASYQWYFSTDAGSSWDAISGATSATYTFEPGTGFVGDAYFKAVVIGADGGVVDSYDAGYTGVKITVVMAPQISDAAASPTEGPLAQTVTLSASVSSTVTATYQWQEYATGSWNDISGATAASSTIQVADAAATLHRYRLAATSLGGTTYSGEVTYQSINPPTFSAVSADPMQGPFSQTVTLQATVSGADSYQWQEYAADSWTDISGATAASSTIQVADGAATLHRYRLAATGLGGTAYSGEVTYQSVAPPVFSSFEVSPLSGGIPLTITFSAAASDTSGYRWEYSTDGTIWVQMASGASGSYTFTNEGVYYVRATATGTGGTTISSAATVTASDLLPEFTSVGVSPEYGVAPFTVTLTAAATNGATFVWERMSGSSWVQVGTGSPLSYVVPEGTADGELRFRATATNQYGSVVSSVVSVEVGSAPPAEITAPVGGSVFGSGRSVSFTAADAGSGVTYSWDFGDGLSASGRTVTHSFGSEGDYTITLTTSSRFGSSVDVVQIRIVEASGDIWLSVTDVSSTGADLQATVEVSPVAAGTVIWFEVSSLSGQVVMRSGEITYNGPVTWEASGLPLMSGQTYSVIAYSNNYGFSIPQMFTLVSAVAGEHETLGTEWENGLSKEPFNIGMLVSSGIATYGTVMGGGAVGSAVAFGVIVMFVLVGLWLRQQDVVIPLTLTLVAGWFVIGNLPGDWQPIAYTLMVVCVVAIFFYLFRKRIE